MSGIIIVVDDEPVVLGFIKELLSVNHYKVEAYCSGFDAYNAFQAHPEKYPLVITDQTMPGMLGIELIQKIHAIKRIGSILCTGYSDQLDQKVAKEMGAYVFLSKPFSSKELLENVGTMLSAYE